MIPRRRNVDASKIKKTLEAYSEFLQRRLKGCGGTLSENRNDALEKASGGGRHVLACKLATVLHEYFELQSSIVQESPTSVLKLHEAYVDDWQDFAHYRGLQWSPTCGTPTKLARLMIFFSYICAVRHTWNQEMLCMLLLRTLLRRHLFDLQASFLAHMFKRRFSLLLV
jgi:hypothetical protein